MSGKILARMSALSLAVMLAACGGDDGSTPIVNVNTDTKDPIQNTDDSATDGNSTDGNSSDNTGGTDNSGSDGNNGDTNTPVEQPVYRLGYLTDITDPTTFVEGQILATPANPRIGNEPARLQVAVLKEATDELALNPENSVTFFSACASSSWASFTPTTVNLDTGIGYAEYTPNEQCAGQDVLYARINDDFSKLAKLVITNQPSSGSTPPSTYKVGSFDNTGTFQEGVLDATNPILTSASNGSNSTDIKLAIVDSSDAIVIDSGLNVDFTSMCLDAGRATIDTTGNTTSGQLLATYTAEGPSGECVGSDSVFALVGTDNQLRASVELTISENNLAIGSFNSADLFTPSLSSSKSALDYNTEAEPSTEIRSVIGNIDTSGNFTPLVGTETKIDFFSTCLDSGLSSIDSTGSTNSGELISTYRAQGCVGTDTIYARIAGTNIYANTSVDILPKNEQVLLLGSFDTGVFNEGQIGKSRTTDLPVGAQTRLYLSLVDSSDQTTRLSGQPLSVQLSSTCEGVDGSASPLAAANLSLHTGYAELIYTAQSCGLVDVDTVTATLTGADGLSATASTTINLDKDPVAHSLTAGQPAPNSIAPGDYDGTYEGRTSTSFIQFTLKNKDGNGTNLANKTITFRLDDPAVSGITLTPASAQTNENGIATVTVKAENGAPNSVFRVIATHENLETYSAPIAVNSRLPFEPNFSLGATNLAPDSWGKSGVTVELSVRAADEEGNRLRGNTVVNFRTGGPGQGTINPDCVLDNEGRCPVTWESLNINAKFAEITAYTHGLKADGTTGEISSTVRMLMSRSEGLQVELLPAQTPYNGGEICARVWTTSPTDGTNIVPPAGTTIEFAVEPANGAFVPESSNTQTVSVSGGNMDSSGFIGCTFFAPEEPFTESMTMTVVATTPEQAGFDNNTANDRLTIQPPTP